MIGKERQYEDRSSDAVAGMHRRARSLSPVRRRYETDSFCPPFHTCATRTRVQKEVAAESTPARPQAKGQAFVGPRFPRHRLVSRFSQFSGEFGIGEAFADDLTDTKVKPLCIGHLAVIKPARLLIDVPKQVEGFHADVGSVQTAFQKAPEVLHCIGVDVSVHVLDRMVDNSVLIVSAQTFIGFQFVAEYGRARFDVLANLRLQFLLAPIVYNHRPYVAAALHHAKDHGFIFPASASDNPVPFRLVHVTGLATDKSLVYFHLTCELATLFSLLGKSDAVEQEPSGLLGYSERPRDLATADAILGVLQHPDGRKPFVKADRRVFHDGADLDGELPLRVADATLPAQLVLEKADRGAAADRADNALLPFGATGYEVSQAIRRIGEVENRFLEGLGFVGAFHTSIVPQIRVLVKYIFALI